MQKYAGLDHEEDKWRAVFIKEQRAELVKEHLWVLWTDYFKPEHLEKFPDLHDKFWKATKQAGNCKKTTDPVEGQKLLDMIAEIDDIFQATKKA
jgi:nickel superoxide dismutase